VGFTVDTGILHRLAFPATVGVPLACRAQPQTVSAGAGERQLVAVDLEARRSSQRLVYSQLHARLGPVAARAGAPNVEKGDRRSRIVDRREAADRIATV